MAAKDCLAHLIEKYGISDEDAQTIIQTVQAMGEGKPRASLAAKRGARDMAADLDAAAGQAKKEAILRTKHRADRTAGVESFDDRFAGLEAETVGTTAGLPGSRRSTDAFAKKSQGETLGALLNDLGEVVGAKNIVRLVADREFNFNVAREMWRGLDGSTGDKLARDVGEVLGRHKDALVERANQAGAFIKHLPGHIFTQHHDTGRMLSMGREQWQRVMLKELDIEETFGQTPAGEIPGILDEIWINITTGTRAVGTGKRSGGFGGSSLAARLSRDRVLHFKDADAAMRYNDLMGGKTAMSSVFSNIRSLAHDAAIMEKWGPNPDDMFERMLNKYEREMKLQWQDKKRTLNPATWLTPWRDPVEALNARWEHLTGTVHNPKSQKFARAMQNFRDWEVLTKMGGVLITSFTDLVNGASIGRVTGRSLLSTYGDQIASLLPQGEAKTQVLRSMGFGMDSVLSDIAGRFSVTDGTTGAMSKLADQMFKLNGLRWWTDSLDAGHAWGINTMMADSVQKPFAALDARLQESLAMYRIGEEQWAGLQAAVRQVKKGSSIIAEDLIDDIETRISFATFIQDTVDTAIPKPGARERAIVLGRTHAGTTMGELTRTMAQFKMFSLTVLTRVWPRVARDNLPGWAHMILGTTAMGYASMTMRDALSGKEPQDMARASTWAASLARGGGVGILGDIMLHDYGKFGRGLPEVFAGPVVGTLDDITKIISGVINGREEAANAFRIAMQNLPFGNLYYLKAALDYLFTYQVLESVNPGHMRRMERRLEEEGGGFWLRPQDVPRNPLIPRF